MSKLLAVITATLLMERAQQAHANWQGHTPSCGPLAYCWRIVHGTGGLVAAYEVGRLTTDAPLLAYLHDDVSISEDGWDERVVAEFSDPTVGLVGFGGALGWGDPDIYKVRYRKEQLARSDYLSNVDDAETHGRRFEGACDVAVLDGFALVVRRELLERAGGWPTKALNFHMYDEWLCLQAWKQGYRIRMVGIRSLHSGGQTSTKGTVPDDDHDRSHEWLYEQGRSILPVEVRR